MRAVRVCFATLLLSTAGCTNARVADSELCARYKRVLLRYQGVEPLRASQTVDGSYDAYRCPMDDAPDVQPSLAECTTRLEEQCSVGSSCSLDLLTVSPGCTRGLLTLVQRDAYLSHDGTGRACAIPGYTPDDLPRLTLVDGASRSCETEQCLTIQGGPPRCTCRCSTAYDEPTCECPPKFRCRTQLTPDFDVARDGYCVSASP